MPNTSIGFMHANLRVMAFIVLDDFAGHIVRVSGWLSWGFLFSWALMAVAVRYVLGPALRIDWEALEARDKVPHA